MFESATEPSHQNSPAPTDPSHEIDQLLGDLDLVLRCRCCEPRTGFFAAESWAAADAAVSAEFSLGEAHWGETQ